MTGGLPVVTPKQLIRALKRKGWEIDRVRGSHYVLVHPTFRRALPVPFHNRDLKRGTLSGIIRSAGITVDELRALL